MSLFKSLGLGVACASLVFLGCNGNMMTKKDPDIEKWSTLAETSKGSSPSSAEHQAALKDVGGKPIGTIQKSDVSEKRLPTQKVSLKMHQTDVKSVLRALAKSAGKNVLVKNDIKGEVTVDFNNVPWDQVFLSILSSNGLSYVWEGEIIRVSSIDDLDLEIKRKSQELGVKLAEPLATVWVPVNYAKPKDMKENLETFLTKDKEGKARGSVRVDEHSNALIISAIRDDLQRMAPIIANIDKPTPQVHIKANIVETSKGIARQLGIQWGGVYKNSLGNQNYWVTPGGSSTTTTDPVSGGYTPVSGTPGLSGQGFGVNFPILPTSITNGVGSLGLMYGTIGGNILEMQLNALEQDNKANILSTPSIVTLDNQTASTENGEEVPITTRDTNGNLTTIYKTATLKLEITPHVIDSKHLKMEILVKKDDVDNTRHDILGNPYITKKETKTNLIVRNGETIVISGLTTQNKTGSESGVPYLKDIPILGWLFKNYQKSDAMSDVLIFITPSILPVAVASAESAQESAAASKGLEEPTKIAEPGTSKTTN